MMLQPTHCSIVLDAVMDDDGRTRMTFCPNVPHSMTVWWLCALHYARYVNWLMWELFKYGE
jgi:hypothetical protein